MRCSKQHSITLLLVGQLYDFSYHYFGGRKSSLYVGPVLRSFRTPQALAPSSLGTLCIPPLAIPSLEVVLRSLLGYSLLLLHPSGRLSALVSTQRE